MKRYDCYGKDDFGDHYAALHDADPDGDYYLASDVAARDAQCLELLKALGHEDGCVSKFCQVCKWEVVYVLHHLKTNADWHDALPYACNCAHAKLEALLGRTAG